MGEIKRVFLNWCSSLWASFFPIAFWASVLYSINRAVLIFPALRLLRAPEFLEGFIWDPTAFAFVMSFTSSSVTWWFTRRSKREKELDEKKHQDELLRVANDWQSASIGVLVGTYAAILFKLNQNDTRVNPLERSVTYLEKSESTSGEVRLVPKEWSGDGKPVASRYYCVSSDRDGPIHEEDMTCGAVGLAWQRGNVHNLTIHSAIPNYGDLTSDDESARIRALNQVEKYAKELCVDVEHVMKFRPKWKFQGAFVVRTGGTPIGVVCVESVDKMPFTKEYSQEMIGRLAEAITSMMEVRV